LGVGFGIGFGVGFGFGVGVAAGLDVEAAVGVGFEVDDGNSISPLAVVTTGLSESASLSFDGFASAGGVARFADGGASFSWPAVISPAPPSQTMLSGFDEARAARLQRMSPAISATWARAIRTTFRQNRRLAAP